MKKLRKKDSKIKIAISSLLISTLLLFFSCENQTEEKSKLDGKTQELVENVSNLNAKALELAKKEIEASAQLKARYKGVLFELKTGANNVQLADLHLVKKAYGPSFTLRDKKGVEHEVILKENNKVISGYISEEVELEIMDVLKAKERKLHKAIIIEDLHKDNKLIVDKEKKVKKLTKVLENEYLKETVKEENN